MAKIMKAEGIELAKKAARNSKRVADVSLEFLNGLDYASRKTLAGQIANDEFANTLDFYKPDYGFAARDAFIDQALSVWNGIERQRSNAIASFKRACDGMTSEAATALIVKTLEGMNIRGANITNYSITVCRGGERYSGPSLSYNFNREGDCATNPEDAGHRAYSYKLNLSISAGGSSYTIAQMAMINKIQAELIDAAHELEVLFERVNVVSIYGGKEDGGKEVMA